MGWSCAPHSRFCQCPALMQRVIAGIQGLRVDVGEYQRKRDLLCEGLAAIGYQFYKPEGLLSLSKNTD